MAWALGPRLSIAVACCGGAAGIGLGTRVLGTRFVAGLGFCALALQLLLLHSCCRCCCCWSCCHCSCSCCYVPAAGVTAQVAAAATAAAAVAVGLGLQPLAVRCGAVGLGWAGLLLQRLAWALRHQTCSYCCCRDWDCLGSEAIGLWLMHPKLG